MLARRGWNQVWKLYRISRLQIRVIPPSVSLRDSLLLADWSWGDRSSVQETFRTLRCRQECFLPGCSASWATWGLWLGQQTAQLQGLLRIHSLTKFVQPASGDPTGFEPVMGHFKVCSWDRSLDVYYSTWSGHGFSWFPWHMMLVTEPERNILLLSSQRYRTFCMSEAWNPLSGSVIWLQCSPLKRSLSVLDCTQISQSPVWISGLPQDTYVCE